MKICANPPMLCLNPETGSGGKERRERHSGRVDLGAAQDWIRAFVDPVGPIGVEHERPWATVLRVPIAGGVAWFKACGPVQGFEPRLTAQLFMRYPDLVAQVLAHDEERAWLLVADAGTPIGAFGNPPETWLAVLPRYAELQRGEAAHVDHHHLAHGVPDLRVATLPLRFDDLLQRELPLEREEVDRLRAFAPRFADLCNELDARDVPETIQHDDLHMANVYAKGAQLRVLDWGDSSISHPFFSLVFAHWHGHELDAYLEPWGDAAESVDLALRVGSVAHLFKWIRIRDAMTPAERAEFDGWFPNVLRKTLEQL